MPPVFDRRLQYVIDSKSNQITVNVIDRQTDKVVKVLPPETLQRLQSADFPSDAIQGGIVDKEV
jgi:uncharacterized FlaG/YvyC family protein